tara:strand:+ start:648 stop:1367 length:720 start_codon:yes stop_codon:yes gene_type:complete
MGKYDEGAKLLKSGYGALSKLVERFNKLRKPLPHSDTISNRGTLSNLSLFKKLNEDVKLKLDNPGYDEFYGKTYAEIKQKIADQYRREALDANDLNTYSFNLGSSEGVTASASNVKLNPNELIDVPGAMGEEAFRQTGFKEGYYNKLEGLRKKIKEKGYNPEPIIINVREDGVPFLVEGNHRLIEAIASGRPTITANIDYLRGAEGQDGLLAPTKIFKVENIEGRGTKELLKKIKGRPE